jgi:hypothetical protein
VGGDPGEGRFRDDLEIDLGTLDGLALVPEQIEVRRAGHPRGGIPEGLPQETGKLVGRGHGGAGLRHGREQWSVLDLLVRVALLGHEGRPPGERDDRGVPQEWLLEARSQVRRADGLRHTHAGPPGRPGVPVGHVGGSLLGVGEDPANTKALHLHQASPQDRFDEEDVGDAVRTKRFGDEACAGHPVSHLVSPSGG